MAETDEACDAGPFDSHAPHHARLDSALSAALARSGRLARVIYLAEKQAGARIGT